MISGYIKNKYLLISILAVTVILLLGVLTPFFVDNYTSNWENEFEKKEMDIAERLQQIVSEKENSISQKSVEIKKKILEYTPSSKIDFLEIISSSETEKFLVNIFESEKLIGWNKSQIVTYKKLTRLLNKWGTDKGFFYETALTIYLAHISEINSVQIFTVIPVQNKYLVKNSKNQKLGLDDLIEDEFGVSIVINFGNSEWGKNNLKIRNKKDSEIGSFKINAISKNAEVQNLKDNFTLLQSFFAIVAIMFLLVWLFNNIKSNNPFIKIIFFVGSIFIIRFTFLALNIGEYLGFTDLINPIYFSSTFAFGLAKSPLDLFLSVLSILLIGIKILATNFGNFNFRFAKKHVNFFLGLLSIILLVLLYNGFSSTIKSVIFDSSILYFKDASLFSSYQTTFMYLAILLIGLTAILFSLILVLICMFLVGKYSKLSNLKLLFLLMAIAIIFVFIDEYFYSKSSILLSLLFVVFAFGLTHYWANLYGRKTSKIITLLFASSILSISFLNFFNTQLELNSLKTISNELTRANVELYEYYVNDALNKIQKEKLIAEKIYKEDVNYDAEAFLLWNKTLLASEFQGSAINIIDKNKNLLGSFEFNYNNNYLWKWSDTVSKPMVQRNNKFRNDVLSKTIIGIVPIYSDGNVNGYVEAIAYYDTYKISDSKNDKYFTTTNSFEKLAVNFDLLKVYEFNNNKLSSYFTNIFLTRTEKENIKNTVLTKEGEAWVSININNESNIFYIKKTNEGGAEKLIAVGLSNKDITWNLFDFFKVFFIHSIMILTVLLLSVFSNYKKWSEIRISFKSKILISLLLVSIIPLILLASYFKNISDEKNKNAINYKLGKRADNVEAYLNSYLNASTLNTQEVFDKATKDLGINYSVYENENLIYSSEGNYYRIELLPLLLNPNALLALSKYDMQEIILEEKIDNYKFNSLYHKYNIAGLNYTINVSDLFNNYQLPMSGIELNVFLFGTYSLAIILIIILSTFLANQISSPIEKLTKATRSVGSGDMDIQLKNVESGEVKELIEGFNLMVRELKRNQIELAEVERESAWREMAKQVAHEIKNPLTPMKLAVQHLVAAHNDKSEKYNSIFEKVTTTIINQIDTLKNIASEFSSFAKMPSINLENINIVEVVNKTVNLFIEEDCEINVTPKIGSITISSDKEQFQRMIINLIRNSIQAQASTIDVLILQTANIASVIINDNGEGIDNKIIENIFDENFTTKKNGMGLGLALTKRFLNQTNGKIFIEKTSVYGTTIKIEIEKNV